MTSKMQKKVRFPKRLDRWSKLLLRHRYGPLKTNMATPDAVDVTLFLLTIYK